MDYRLSHKGKDKGIHYNKKFFERNYQNFIYQWEELILKSITDKIPDADYLDFACGTGRITRLLVNQVKNTTGVDISEEMLTIARKEVADANFILGDATIGDFEEFDAFDIVTSFRFFTNAQPELRESVLDWISQNVRSGGLFIFNIHMNSHSPYALMARIYEGIFGKRKGFNHISVNDFYKMGLNKTFDIVNIYGRGIIPVLREQKKLSKLSLKLLGNAESLFSYIPGYKYICKYQILVCSRKSEET